jgi:hypothetical protein
MEDFSRFPQVYFPIQVLLKYTSVAHRLQVRASCTHASCNLVNVPLPPILIVPAFSWSTPTNSRRTHRTLQEFPAPKSYIESTSQTTNATIRSSDFRHTRTTEEQAQRTSSSISIIPVRFCDRSTVLFCFLPWIHPRGALFSRRRLSPSF